MKTMSEITEAGQIAEIIDQAKIIVVIQADNPDGDSLSSALALEHILGDLGKEVHLYCGVDIPLHLKYLSGSDRVVKELPNKFDASIIVDTSSDNLLEQLGLTNQKIWLKNKPCIILDHHDVDPSINFASVVCSLEAVATSEVIYELAMQLKWPLNDEAKKLLAIGILSDSLGLMTDSTSARSIHIIGELVDAGVNLAEVDAARRETMRRSPDLVHYKGQLLQRVEYYDDNRIAMVTIPWEEIERYSHEYNPSILVLDDMRLTENTAVAIAYKLYPDGKVTAKIRSNYGFMIASDLAKHFGGGGHPYASGYKIQDGRPYNEVKAETIKVASQLLNELKTKND